MSCGYKHPSLIGAFRRQRSPDLAASWLVRSSVWVQLRDPPPVRKAIKRTLNFNLWLPYTCTHMYLHTYVPPTHADTHKYTHNTDRQTWKKAQLRASWAGVFHEPQPRHNHHLLEGPVLWHSATASKMRSYLFYFVTFKHKTHLHNALKMNANVF